MKILVDTNIILDFFLSREQHATVATKLFEMIYQGKIEAFTTASSVTDIYYITAKRIGDSSAREAVRHLLNILGVIAVDGDDCANALCLPITDFEDALVVTCANKEDIDYIVSNDKEFSQVNTQFAKIVSSYEFLKLM